MNENVKFHSQLSQYGKNTIYITWINEWAMKNYETIYLIKSKQMASLLNRKSFG
jgi:hypothetical protein